MTGMLAAITGYGETAPAVSISLSDQSVFDSSPTTAVASYTINSTGTVTDHDSNVLESWLLGGGTASNYEVRATVVSGTLTSGTTGSWLSCGTTRTWAISNGARDNSTVTCVLTVQIRLASTGIVQDSATVTLSAESFSFN